jgi:hypothetical protein
MELTNTRTIAAPPTVVWAALNDPAILKKCIPGCESLERVTDTEWRAIVTARVGPVALRFNARIALADIEPPTSYTLQFEGQGGAAGFANGEARVVLTATDTAHTQLFYKATATIGGKLAQIGSRLIDGVAAKLAEEFFADFVEYLAPAEPVAVEAPAVVAAAPDTPSRRHPWMLYAGLAGGVLVMILLYLRSMQ